MRCAKCGFEDKTVGPFLLDGVFVPWCESCVIVENMQQAADDASEAKWD